MFSVFPVIDLMLEFYELPRNPDRFNYYLKLLEGDTKGDMKLPISGYNPMAKEHIGEKLKHLKDLKAEEIASGIVKKFHCEKDFEVVINLADDLHGGWTNRFTTDYQSKFQLNPLIERGFCTPYFWSSEEYSEKLIRSRIEEAIYRTVYFSSHPKPQTLEEHIAQEAFVARSVQASKNNDSVLKETYEKIKSSTDYSTIITFLYGDEAAEMLGLTPLGHSEIPLSLEQLIQFDPS